MFPVLTVFVVHSLDLLMMAWPISTWLHQVAEDDSPAWKTYWVIVGVAFVLYCLCFMTAGRMIYVLFWPIIYGVRLILCIIH